MASTRPSAIRAHGTTLVRLLLAAAGALIAILPFEQGLSVFPGALSPVQAWWLVMLACGVFVTAAAAGTQWGWTVLLAASVLAGTSAQLALTEPAWFTSIHIRPTSNFSYLLLLAIAIQAALTAWTILSRVSISTVFRFVWALGLARTALVLALLLAFSVPVTRYVATSDFAEFANQLVLAAGFLGLNIAAATAVALSLPAHGLGALAGRAAGMISAPGAAGELRGFDRHLPVLVALWTLIASGVLCVLVFERMPHVPDEVAYLFHAKYLQNGRIGVPGPPSAAAFEYYLLDLVGDRWFSVNWPGWPFVLSFGTALNLAWLVNPLLAGACVLLAHDVIRRLADRGTANVVVLFLAVSPWFIATSASLMNHTLTLALLLASWSLLLRAREDRSIARALLAGAAMGGIFLTRPLDGLIVGGLTGIWCLGLLADRSRRPMVPAFALGCVATGALIFPYNQYLTGDALVTPLNHYLDRLWYPGANRLGFGPDIGPENRWLGIDLYRGHGPAEALVNSQQNAQAANTELFGWGVGSLALVFAHMAWGRWSRSDRYMAAIVAATIGAYGLYWFSGSFYIGPRYWFMVLLPLVVLSAAGARALAARLDGACAVTLGTQRLAFVVGVLCVLSVVSFTTWRSVAKYHEFRGFHAGYRDLVEEHDLDGSLVFVQTDSEADFGSAFVFNPPDLSGPGPIFARDLGPESNRSVARAFPDRPVYFVVGRSEDGTGPRIVGGPVPAGALP